MKSNTLVLLFVAIALGLGIFALEQGVFTPVNQEQDWQNTSWETKPEEKAEEKEQEPISHKGYAGALEEAKAANMDVLIFFTADWCPHCQKMKNETLSNEKVKKALEKYILYMCNTDQEQNIAKSYGVKGIPAYFIIDAEKSTVETPQILKTGKGCLGVTSFLTWLNVNPNINLPWKK